MERRATARHESSWTGRSSPASTTRTAHSRSSLRREPIRSSCCGTWSSRAPRSSGSSSCIRHSIRSSSSVSEPRTRLPSNRQELRRRVPAQRAGTSVDKLWVVIKREYLERVRSKWFLVGTLLVPALIVVTFLLPAFLTSRSTASSGVRNVIILDATGIGLGDRVATDLLAPPATGRLGTDAAADTAGVKPEVRIIDPARLAEAETTATHQ